MAFQTFYWKGSTAANLDSFNWNSLGNWRVLSTIHLPTLISANRLPKGGDTVIFGRSYCLCSSSLPSIPSCAILSPCLFGGPGNTGGSWVGATGTALETNGELFVRARPSYPFSKLGGKLDVDILNQWHANLKIQGVSGATGAEWRLASGTEGTDAVWTCTNWFGATGQTLYYANLGGTYINVRGQWQSQTKAGCLTDIFGVTGASAGCSGQNFDGSLNKLVMFNSLDVKEFGYLPYGNINTIHGWTGYNYATPTSPNDTYLSGDVIVRGRFNYLRQLIATRNSNISLIGAKINDVSLYPTAALVLNTSGAIAGVDRHDVGIVPVSVQSYFDMQLFYMDEASTARKIKIGNIDQLNSNIIIHGDITASGGFDCALDTFAGSSGGISVPLGSFEFFPPATAGITLTGDRLQFGFISSEGTKAATVITNIFANDGSQSMVYSVEGNFTVTNFYIYKGTLEYSYSLSNNSNININNLSMYNTSVFDGTPVSPQFQGLNNVTINPQSNSIKILPGIGNKLTFSNLNQAID